MNEEKNLEDYEFLVECAKNNDADNWNAYRKKDRRRIIDISKADISGLNFEKFNLKGMIFNEVNASAAKFRLCAFDQAELSLFQGFGVIFDQCNFVSVKMENANFSMAEFTGCDFRFSDLSKSKLHQMKIIDCKLDHTILKETSFNDTLLRGSSFQHTSLEDSEFIGVGLHSAKFTASTLNGGTVFWNCYYDKDTDFTGVGLSTCRIELGLSSALRCNIRRLWWKNWHLEKQRETVEHFKEFLKSPVKNFTHVFKGFSSMLVNFTGKAFWKLTDYGTSTLRLLGILFSVVVVYTVLYSLFPSLMGTGITANADKGVIISSSIYCAITRLMGIGSGVNSLMTDHLTTNIFTIIQTIIGYILFAAFILRLGILFQGEFPVSKSKDKFEEK